MSLFFVLSGFVITYNYADYQWRAEPFSSLWRFVYLRVSRLYPALLLFFVMILYRLPDADPRAWEVTALHLFSSQSWFPFVYKGSILAGSRFNIAWSISTEIMMYLMFAVAMITIARWPRLAFIAVSAVLAGIMSFWLDQRWIVSLIASTALIEPMTEGQAVSWFFYISPWFRILDFAAGAMAAYIVMSGCLSRLPLWMVSLPATTAMIFIIAFHVWRVLGEHGVYFVTVQLISTVAFFFVVLGSTQRSVLNWLLSVRALTFVGLVSYSLYLFHGLAPYFLGFHQTGSKQFSASSVLEAVGNMAVAVPVAVLIAAVAFFLVERPGQLAMRWLIAKSPTRLQTAS